MDTVTVSGPIKAVVADGVVRSAGDTILGGDDKAACAVLLAVLADLAATPPACGLEAIFSTCEEVGLRGAKALDLKALTARAGFVFDSAGPVGAVITRAPSQKMLTADFHGVAAHAGIAPERGRSAIAAAAAAVAAMKLGRIDAQTTANVGLISGGSAVNVVPEHCRIEAEVRSHDRAALVAQTAQLVDAVELAAGLAGIDVELTVRDAFAAFALDDDALPVRIACAALRDIGIEPPPHGERRRLRRQRLQRRRPAERQPERGHGERAYLRRIPAGRAARRRLSPAARAAAGGRGHHVGGRSAAERARCASDTRPGDV